MESRDHFEARAAFEHAVEASNQVAGLVRLKYEYEAELKRVNEKAWTWQIVAWSMALALIMVITQL